MLELEAADDRFTIGWSQLLQRRFITGDALASDRDVERRRRFGLVRIGKLGRRRTAGESTSLVANPIEHGLAQVRLERPLMTRVESIEAPQRVDDRVLYQVLGVERAARGRWQSPACPAAQRRQAPREQSIQCFAIALSY